MIRKPIVIKKYENRRLYDTTNSRYINQDEIARMVREGHEIQVLDAATGEDLTRLVLTQIIVEDAKEPDSTFPLDILRQMVIASGKATQENTLKYMKAVLDMYQNAYRAFTPPVSPFEFIPPVPRPAPTPATPPDSSHEQELQRRVEELEAMVAKMAGGKKRVRRPRPKSRRPA
ncbi:MAG TPA: polyhydroxyalkanoate synthesis regulator DNA-binding domain-containing protein [Candidatus Binatia bacterium]|nr:polyhydroxyalkanoate synthesis regulator DNA-binding domain-containing protein [Candidatus Binatia bacterium]